MFPERSRRGDRSEIGCTPSQHIRHDALGAVLRVVDLHLGSQTALAGASRLSAQEIFEQTSRLPPCAELVWLAGSKSDLPSVAAPIPFRNDFRLGHLPSSLYVDSSGFPWLPF